MKNKILFILVFHLSLNIINLNSVFGQATSGFTTAGTANRPVSTNPPDFLGWDNTVTIPLEIRHDNDDVIQFWINGDYRARIGNSSEFSLIVGDGASCAGSAHKYN